MRALLLLCLAAGFVNSAILDSSKLPISKKGEWDDEDSMILAPSTTTIPSISPNDTTTPPIPTETSTDQEDLITGEQNRPRFISLIPAGTHKVNGNTIPSKSDQENQNQEDKMKYQIYSDSTPKVEEDYATSSSSDDGGDSTTPPSSSSSEESDDDVSTSEAQGTTERSPSKPQLRHITLGKIPLTYEIIPLLPPREEKQQLLGREDTTPIGFFPPELQESTLPQEMITDKAKREEQPTTTTSTESEGEGEIITGKPVPELQELPPEPLTYMVPPRMEHDGETTVIWNLYPMTTDADDSSIDLTSPQSTINPLLERINDFLMKAKRHSLETETTTITTDSPSTTIATSTEENDENTEKMETTTSAENDDDSSNAISTTNENHFAISDTPEDSNGDLNPSSPVPIPEEPTEEIYTTTHHLSPTTTILYPTPNIPEIQDYYSQPAQSLPESPITYFTPPPPPPPQQATTQNILQFPPPSSPDQYFSDYHNINTLQQQDHQQPINPFYYTNPSQSSQNSAAALLRRRLMIASLLNKLASSMPSSSTTTPPPSQPIYIPNDSYWPSKYFNNRGSSVNTNNIFSRPVSDYNTNYNPNYQTNYQTNYNPYINPSNNGGGFSRNYFPQQQQNSYVYPQQQQTTAIPLQAALNVIAASSEEPSYSPYGGSFGGGVDDYSSIPSNPPSPGRGSPYNSNPYYSPSSSSTHYRRSSDGYNNFVNDNYYSSSSYYPSTQSQGSAYDINFRPVIPYRPYQYPVTSSELVNRLMYAPLYPYERYNRGMNMRAAGFY